MKSTLTPRIGYEYSYDIDVVTGQIVEWDKERD